jgi:hypothetical protein
MRWELDKPDIVELKPFKVQSTRAEILETYCQAPFSARSWSEVICCCSGCSQDSKYGLTGTEIQGDKESHAPQKCI